MLSCEADLPIKPIIPYHSGCVSRHACFEGRAKFAVAYTQIVYLATFLGPMIGTGLRSAGINLVAVILVGALLRFLAACLTQFHALEWVERALHIEVFTTHS